jgi:hypothetical protein
MKVACSSETSVYFHCTIQSYILEDITHQKMSRLRTGVWKEKNALCCHKMTLLLKILLLARRQFFLIGVVGGGVQLGPLGTAATNRPVVPASGDYDDGEIGGMIGRGTEVLGENLPQCRFVHHKSHMPVRTGTRAIVVGSLRLTALVTTRPARRQTVGIPAKTV